MSPVEIILIAVAAFFGGALGGIVGVGGGVVFVSAMVIFAGEGQLRAEATSLLAIIAVAAVGAWRQTGYGNVNWKHAVWIGVLSPIGVVVGVVVANTVPERALEIGFALLLLFLAFDLLKRGLRTMRAAGPVSGPTTGSDETATDDPRANP